MVRGVGTRGGGGLDALPPCSLRAGAGAPARRPRDSLVGTPPPPCPAGRCGGAGAPSSCVCCVADSTCIHSDLGWRGAGTCMHACVRHAARRAARCCHLCQQLRAAAPNFAPARRSPSFLLVYHPSVPCSPFFLGALPPPCLATRPAADFALALPGRSGCALQHVRTRLFWLSATPGFNLHLALLVPPPSLTAAVERFCWGSQRPAARLWLEGRPAGLGGGRRCLPAPRLGTAARRRCPSRLPGTAPGPSTVP